MHRGCTDAKEELPQRGFAECRCNMSVSAESAAFEKDNSEASKT